MVWHRFARISRGSSESYLPLQGPSPRAAQRLAARRVLGIKQRCRSLVVPILRPHGTIKRDFVLEPSVSMILASYAALLYETSATRTHLTYRQAIHTPLRRPLVDTLEPPIAATLGAKPRTSPRG